MLRFTIFTLMATLALSQPLSPDKKLKLFNQKDLQGWYTYLQQSKYSDPKSVFRVQNGMLRISGEEWGGIATKNSYRDYHLVVEWKWGEKTWGDRAKKARDSGILVHATGEDGAYNGMWLESIESQIIEGGTGDFILVGGKGKPSMTVQVREHDGQLYWDRQGKPETRDRGRFNWFGRDPGWQDVLGFRGKQDVDRPVGEWNRQEVIAKDDTLTNIVNGVVVNVGTRASHKQGKIQLQSEGAEIWFRVIELRPLDK
jgi:hypothetical protein